MKSPHSLQPYLKMVPFRLSRLAFRRANRAKVNLIMGGLLNPSRSVWRWREQAQNNFAERMDWCAAGHPK